MRSHTLSRSATAAAVVILGLAGLTGCGTEKSSTEKSSTEKVDAVPAAPAASHADAITVEDPWVRATTGTEDPSMTAAFMVLDNESDTEVTVTGARSEVAGMTQIHEMAMVDGEMVMREKQGGLALAPHQGQVLQPGGLHVMLMNLRQDLAPGDEVQLTLVLADGSEVEVTAPVKAFTEETGHYHEAGTPSDHAHP